MGVRRGLTVLVVGVVVVAASGFATAPGGVGGPTMGVSDGDRTQTASFPTDGGAVSASERLDGPADTIRAKFRPASDAAAQRLRSDLSVRHEFDDVLTATVSGAEYQTFENDPDVDVAPVQRVGLTQSGEGPEVGWASPTDGDTVDGTVELTIEAATSVGDVERVAWRVDGGSTQTAERVFWSSYWQAEWNTTDVADGTHQLTAVVELADGTTEEATIEVTVANGEQPPTVSWATPTDGGSITGDVPLRIEATDPDGSVETVTWQVDDGEPRSATASGNGTWEAALNASTLTEGAHELTARAVDAAGTNQTATIPVNVGGNGSGTDGPSITWHSPTDGQQISGETQVALGVDANGSVGPVGWQVDGGNPQPATYNESTGRYTAALNAGDLQPGTHDLRARALTEGGANATASITVEVGDANDTGPGGPDVTWMAPRDTSKVRGETAIAIDAEAAGSVDAVTWRVAGGEPRPASVDETTGRWTATWNASTVDVGSHDLTAVAVDESGNRTQTTIDVDVVPGENPPSISWESPADGETVDGTVPIRLSASDEDGTVQRVAWAIEGGEPRTVNRSDGAWTDEVNASAIPPGDHTLIARAIDDDRLVVNDTIDVTVNGTARSPNASWHSPHDGEAVEGFVKLQVEADDPDGTIERAAWQIESRDPQPLTYNDDTGYWEDDVDVDGVESGNYTLRTRVADNHNETAEAAVEVKVDNTNQAPTVEWTAPTDDETVSGEIDLEIEASDPDGTVQGVRWTVNDGEPRTPSEGDGNTWTATLDTTELEDGAHTLRAGVKDGDGADAFTKIGINVDNAGQAGDPSLRWAWPRNGETLATDEVPIRINASGGTVDQLRWQVDGGNPRTASYDEESGYYEATWDTRNATTGDHELRTRAQMESGATASATVAVTVSGQATPGANGSTRPPTRVPYGVGAVYNRSGGTPSGGDVDVAVLDSGVDSDHPDLAASVVRCVDAIDAGNCQDQRGHGTHVAGLVAADGGDGEGLFGVAPAADLHAYKVVDERGAGYADDVAAAIRDAAENDVEVVVLSARTEASGSLVEYAIDQHRDDLLVLAAAGNGGPETGTVAPPASSPGVVAVGALDRNGRPLNESARGSAADSFCECDGHLELVAAGDSVPSTWLDGGYNSISGTSVATPQAAGVAAKAWASGAADLDGDGTVTPAEVREFLRSQARNPAGPGYNPATGVGVPTVPAGG